MTSGADRRRDLSAIRSGEMRRCRLAVGGNVLYRKSRCPGDHLRRSRRRHRCFAVFAVDLNLAVSARMLTLGVFIPVSGGVGDPFGVCKMFADALGLHALLAGPLPGAVAARVRAGSHPSQHCSRSRCGRRSAADCRSGRSALDFFFNLPFGLVAFVMASLLVPIPTVEPTLPSTGRFLLAGNTQIRPFLLPYDVSPYCMSRQSVVLFVR